ncbi:hypothetical protein FB446DRAFT_787672 [Lentinula raphanica]|nr:hypothetical protein FB446DRAFT_787672 [Lentinula raphanica]
MVLWTWKGGKHIENSGFHSHPRITHLLHVLPNERVRFEELIDNNPDATPAQLLIGQRTLSGQRKSASNISPVYNNRDRIAKDRQRIINSAKYSGGDKFISGFREFHQDHPNFIVHSIFGEINMICMQSDFMRVRLVNEISKRHREPVNGIVSDAAHGFWREQNSLLITSSVYEPELRCWIPILFSYSDGASTEHYTHHFLVLMLSISHQCNESRIPLTDKHFAGITDFSQAERGGFIEAFIAFWTQDPNDTRSEAELEDASRMLLRGCEEHFRASVTRIKKIHGVVAVGSEEQFERLTLGLLESNDHDDFYARVEVIQREFPLADSWLGWWLRESIAEMLFQTHTQMEPDIWDSIPSTTNAQEAQHWKLYSAVGRDHSLLQGLEALHAVSDTALRLFEANLEGGLIRYGEAEPWKAMINLIGRSKPTRALGNRKSKQKSDGRPPDTKQDLLRRASKSPAKKRSTRAEKKTENPSIVVDLIYRAISKDYPSFASRFSSTTQTERPIRDMYNVLSLRHHGENQALILRDPTFDLLKALFDQRNSFRETLVKWRVIKDNNSHGNIFDWFSALMKAKFGKDTDSDNWAQSYFQSMFATVKHCSGEGQNSEHYQIRSSAEIRYHITLRSHVCRQFGGDIAAYFHNYANVNHPPETFPSCWRTRDGTPQCKGSHTDVRFLLSLPVVLVLEEEELESAGSTESWDFPQTFHPFKSGDLAKTSYDNVKGLHESRTGMTGTRDTGNLPPKIMTRDLELTRVNIDLSGRCTTCESPGFRQVFEPAIHLEYMYRFLSPYIHYVKVKKVFIKRS